MSTLEAHNLIIKNASMLEDVFTEYSKVITPAVISEIDKLVEEFARSKGWSGVFGYLNDETIWFAPANWKNNDTEESDEVAYYYLTLVKDNNETGNDDVFTLSPFLGIVDTQAGFCFKVERKDVGNPKASEWKKFCQNHPLYIEVNKIGFNYLNSGSWFIPFNLNSDVLAESYCSENTVDALQPISEALSKISEAHALFDQILTDAKENKWGQP